MASRTYYHLRMPCQALCKIEHACGHAGWERVEYGIASPPPHWRLTLRADAARLANRPYHFAAQSALNGAIGRFPLSGPPPSSPAALGIPAKGWPWRRGGVACHWQAAPMTPERAKAVPCRHGAESQLQTKMPSVKLGIFIGWSMGYPLRAAPLVPSCAGDTRQGRALAARGRGLPLASHAHDTGTEANASPHAVCRIPLGTRQKSPP